MGRQRHSAFAIQVTKLTMGLSLLDLYYNNCNNMVINENCIYVILVYLNMKSSHSELTVLSRKRRFCFCRDRAVFITSWISQQ